MSPYENRLTLESFRRIGLIAFVRPGHDAALAKLCHSATIRPGNASFCNVQLFARRTEGRTMVFAYLEYQGTDVESAPGLLRADAWFAELAPHLEAHDRATAAGSPWTRMELINVIGPTLPPPQPGAPVAKSGLISGLRPDCELTYRTLHQTNWPGVIDQMARSHCRYWVTFLMEFGNELKLFTYSEYVGTNRAADDAAMAADPVTQRWWKHTEPCLLPQSADGGSWTRMETFTPTTV
jgi:L-rhamnose mutarotase